MTTRKGKPTSKDKVDPASVQAALGAIPKPKVSAAKYQERYVALCTELGWEVVAEIRKVQSKDTGLWSDVIVYGLRPFAPPPPVPTG